MAARLPNEKQDKDSRSAESQQFDKVIRLLEYRAMLNRIYSNLVRQYVLY